MSADIIDITLPITFGSRLLWYVETIVILKIFHETLDYKKPMNVYFESLQINDEKYLKKENAVS